MRILLTGGGTAGHAWPVVLVAQSLLKNKRVQILYVGSRQGIEKKLAHDFDVPFRAIFSGKRRAYFSLLNFWDIFKIAIGVIQAFFILVYFRPKIIFAKGGYATVPIIFWLRFLKIPLVIHESDVVMGRANLWALKWAKTACLGFPIECYKQNLPLEKLVYTGNPVRSDFTQTSIKSGNRLKILITGGSQGSSKINNLVAEILPELLEKYEVWHLSGERDFGDLSKIKHPFYHLFSFSYELPKFMRDADLVITRAGANTLSEIAATSRASIVIPLESAANEHQDANAEIFKSRNAAVVLSEKNLTANSLRTIIFDLLSDEPLRELLGHHAHSLFQKQAVEEIVDCIFKAQNEK